MPADIGTNIIIAITKKVGADKCEVYSTINLISHVTKILTRIM